MRFISQLIKCILKVFQKLLKYFTGINIWTSFLPLASSTPVIFNLYLNDLLFRLAPLKRTTESTLFRGGSFLQYCHKLPDVFK